MKKHLSKRRVVLAAIVAVVLAIASGVAYAYWTASGSGTGSAAAAASTSNVVVNQTALAAGALYPGAAIPLSGTFDNLLNPGSVYIGSVTASVTSVAPTTCLKAWFTITGTSTTPGEIAHGSAVGTWSGLTLNMPLAPTLDQNICKSAVLTITYATT